MLFYMLQSHHAVALNHLANTVPKPIYASFVPSIPISSPAFALRLPPSFARLRKAVCRFAKMHLIRPRVSDKEWTN